MTQISPKPPDKDTSRSNEALKPPEEREIVPQKQPEPLLEKEEDCCNRATD